MRIRVMKFGGTSVNSDESRAMAAAKVIQARENDFGVVVVVSAIGRRGAPYATDTLIQSLLEIDREVEPNARELDLMMACGEIISTVIFAHTLKINGYPAVALTGGQAGIVTDPVFGNARITEISPQTVVQYLEEGNIVVVCGFQGVARPAPGGEHEAITTLGRGGSDTTAAALGAALKADAVDIFTDVDGVKTADPDSVPTAPTLRQVSYLEVAEIAHQGAKVLHPRAAEIAMRYNIPLWVRSTFSDEPGTEVVPDNKAPNRRITGVTHTGKLNYFAFPMPSEPDRSRIAIEVYRQISLAESNLHLISVNPGYLGLAVPSSHFAGVCRQLDGLVVPFRDASGSRCYILQVGLAPSTIASAQSRLIEESGAFDEVRRLTIDVTENCTMVSVIGRVSGDQPGIFHTVLDTLDQAGIQVLQTSDSDHSLSCLISETETNRAVRLLHDRFELERAG